MGTSPSDSFHPIKWSAPPESVILLCVPQAGLSLIKFDPPPWGVQSGVFSGGRVLTTTCLMATNFQILQETNLLTSTICFVGDDQKVEISCYSVEGMGFGFHTLS